MDGQIFDVAIIGYGPVGQSLAIAPGQKGHSVIVFDRYPALYPLPRAVSFDHEIHRIFGAIDAIGAGPGVEAISHPAAHYQWFNADWKLLVEFDWTLESVSGGPLACMFSQPNLEAVLDARARSIAGVRIVQGWEAVGLAQDGNGCDLVLRDTTHHKTCNKRCNKSGNKAGNKAGISENPENNQETTEKIRHIRARYVVGADGASSVVRAALGIGFDNLGFQEDWLVVDVKPHPGVKLDVPELGQWCNPARPTTIVSGGPGMRRREFMRLPDKQDEPAETWASDEKVRRLLAKWMTPARGTLVRKATYTFRSRIAARWRDRRVLLAGDAAHQMPPFMGQGMCSGICDAWNLAWRLDLILTRTALAHLLDGYEKERQPQIRAVIDASVAVGRVICVSSPEEAALRDEAFFSGRVPSLAPFPGLTDGLIARDTVQREGIALAGQLSVRGKIGDKEWLAWYDEKIAGGFHVIAWNADPDLYLDGEARDFLRKVGGQYIGLTLDPEKQQPGKIVLDGNEKYDRFFKTHGVPAIVVRPDFYIYGAVCQLTDLPPQLAGLRKKLPQVSDAN